MKLYIGGINHNSPRSRIELIGWLHEIKSLNHTNPDFIATEWDEEVFLKILAQRLEFSLLVNREWPFLNDDDLNSISQTLGFEGDSHKGIFENVNILWLDHSRIVEPDIIENYAEKRFNLLKIHGRDILDKNNFVDKLGANLKITEVNEAIPTERDVKFANTISGYVEKNNCVWGVVIVGSLHASQEVGMMRNLLEQKHYECVVRYF